MRQSSPKVLSVSSHS